MKLIRKLLYPITIICLIFIIAVVFYLKQKLNNQKYDNIEINDELIVKEETKKEDIATVNTCKIDIKGAVKNPGVYSVDCTHTVNDVISVAGGLKDNADTSVINLAKAVENEMVIIIYTKEEVKNSNIVDTVVKVVEKECVCPNIQNDGCINDEITDNIGEDNSELININTATLSELQSLTGIGESKAKAIIKYREENGNFKTIDDLLNVDGIGENLYEQIKAYITT